MYKRHRVNHDFQILHFLVGGCHTADAAYALLLDQREDRSNAIALHDAGEKKRRAHRIRLELQAKTADECGRLEAESDLETIEATAATGLACYEAAKEELAFIDNCLKELEPRLQHYGKLGDHAAAEAAQHEEWKLELIYRAQNYLMTQGSIPHDHFATMRQHPDFSGEILPAIEQLRTAMQSRDRVALHTLLEDRPRALAAPSKLALKAVA